MKPIYISLVLILSSGLCYSQDDPYFGLNVKEVSFYSHDNVKIYADIFIVDRKNATIILFHQAGSNARGEYASILPRLVEKGFNILAVDQRSGGNLYGSENRTAKYVDNEYSYCQTYPDFEASIDYLKQNGFENNIIVWGSSYSGSLAIQLGTKRKEVSGVIAFSPASGRAMDDCKPDAYIAEIQKPVLIMRPSKEVEMPSAKNQLELANKYGHKFFIASDGIHGSSMLVAERFIGNPEPTWNRVMLYLSQFDKERIDLVTAEEVNEQVWKPFKTSFETRDWEVFNQLHTDDVLRVTSRGIRLGSEYKNSVKSSYQKFDARKRQIDFWFEHRIYKSDIGYEVGYYRIIYTEEGKDPFDSYGRFHVVLKKKEGKWLISQDWDTGKINNVKISEEDFNKGKLVELD